MTLASILRYILRLLAAFARAGRTRLRLLCSGLHALIRRRPLSPDVDEHGEETGASPQGQYPLPVPRGSTICAMSLPSYLAPPLSFNASSVLTPQEDSAVRPMHNTLHPTMASPSRPYSIASMSQSSRASLASIGPETEGQMIRRENMVKLLRDERPNSRASNRSRARSRLRSGSGQPTPHSSVYSLSGSRASSSSAIGQPPTLPHLEIPSQATSTARPLPTARSSTLEASIRVEEPSPTSERPSSGFPDDRGQEPNRLTAGSPVNSAHTAASSDTANATDEVLEPPPHNIGGLRVLMEVNPDELFRYKRRAKMYVVYVRLIAMHLPTGYASDPMVAASSSGLRWTRHLRSKYPIAVSISRNRDLNLFKWRRR
jgi:hypothetical protein